MDFRVLGPLEVRDGDRVVPLGGFRQRLVLAVLLLYVDRSVSVDRLIDAVWGDEPPRTARKTLQVYVSRLRSLLGPEVIEATPHGYVLHIPSGELDAKRFESLASEGHKLAVTDPRAAAGVFRRSLGLWRGMPWGELGDEAAIQPEAQRLRELRLSVLEARIGADLASGRASGLVGEVEGLVDEHPLRERFRLHLMLALYRSGRQADALRLFSETRRLLGEELGIEPSLEIQDLEEKILLHDPSIDGPPDAAPTEDWTLSRNPYKGLRTFAEPDADDFFGRTSLVDEILSRINTRPLVAVVGASGSGKSSAVMAGVLPRLRLSAPPGAEHWLVTTMVPGRHPFDQFEAAERSTPGDRATSTSIARADTFALLRAVQRMAGDERTRVLLVIDQFEELFHQVTDDAERTQFIRNLIEAVEDPHSQLTVLITLRADFFDRAISEPSLGRLINAGVVNVLPLEPVELEAAAARPAERVGTHLEPELIAELVSGMADQPGSLPLFQYLLAQLFDERTGMVLTRSVYRRIGGLQGALARRAENVYQALDGDQQAAAKQLLLRLVTVGEDQEPSRRRVPRQELESLAVDPANVKVAFDGFDEARLLTFDRSPVTGQATVEVAHEALLREWPRLHNWLDDAREDLRLHQALASEVEEWEGSDRDPDYLLTGSRLDLHVSRAGDSAIELTGPEQEFLTASIGRRDRERKAEEERRNQALQVEQRSVRRLRWLVAVVSVAALVAAALTVFATDQSREASTSQREARARELANAALANLDTDPELAILLSLQSMETTRSAGDPVLREAKEALHLAIPAHRIVAESSGGSALAFHPDGGLLIGGFEPRIIDPVSGAVRLEIPRHASGWLVQAVAISPNGSLLATGTDHQGAVMLWDASTGARVTDLHGPVDSIGPMAFSPDGLMLAALAPFGGGVFVWDVTTGEQMARGVDRSAWDVCCPPAGLAFSPDGSRIAVTTFSGVVKVLDIASGEWVMTLSGHTSPVSGVEYLAGKNTLITGSMDGSIRMWDATTGTQISAVDAGIGQIISLDVSPDGQRLLVGGDGGGVGLWALETSTIRPLAALPGGHHSFVMQVAFDQSGRIGASSTLSGEVLIWDATPSGPGEVAAWTAGRPAAFSGEGRMIATTGPGGRDVVIRGTSDWQTRVVLEDVAPYVGQPDEEWGHVSGMSFSPDGDRLVTATGSRLETVDGSVTIWDIASGEPIRTLFHHPFMKGPPAWSGNGSRIAVAACDDFGAPGRVWDAETGELVFTTPGAACGQSVDLDHSGRFLAVQTLADSHNVRVWDVDTGELVSAMTHSPLWIGAVAFNPDGTRIVTGGGDGTARIWDVADGGLVRTLTGHTGALEDAIWSSDGSTVITGSHDGTIRLWNANTGETDLVLGDHGTFPFVAISPDGRYLASGVETGVQIWALNLDDLIEIARTRGGRPLSEAECIAYHFETCPTSP